jgi:hypothetical protein
MDLILATEALLLSFSSLASLLAVRISKHFLPFSALFSRCDTRIDHLSYLADGMKHVAEHLDGLLQGLASAGDEDAQGFCAALLSKLVRHGFAEKVIHHANALSTVVKVLENQKSDVDVDSACIGVLSSACESGVEGATEKVDQALGAQTFSTLLSRQESECVNGAFLLMSHVATLPNTRNNLLGDSKLMQLIFKSFASSELVGHAANAFLSLAIDGAHQSTIF